MHGASIGGHSGIQNTYQRIQGVFLWSGLRSQVKEWVKNCHICQLSKHENVKTPRLLQPLPIPEGAWTCITMDFIVKLPKSHGKESIWVVVDRFTKYGHFIALSQPVTASTLAQTFIKEIYKLHGVTQQLNQLLREAQARMKFYSDQDRSERHFEEGELVYLKLNPYKQLSLRKSHLWKLTPKYCGPFAILKKIGPVAYELDLPTDSKVHPVFHVSQLKKHIGTDAQVPHSIPPLDESKEATWENADEMGKKFPIFSHETWLEKREG
ncbi:hypothetical protein ABFS83_10G071300 [Erythranthe nasuta]